MSFDLNAYLTRLGYTGPREPTLAVLAELQHRHVCTIPFENLDVLLGRPIRLDLPSVQQKLVSDRRGGYCFEHNTLFQAALSALGFNVTPLVARVRWQVPADIETALTHMILLVAIDRQRHLVDTGFGFGSLTAPLDLDTDAPQPTSHEPHRLLRRDDVFIHQIQFGQEWADLYHFTLQPSRPIDYEVACWFTSTYPQSKFVQNLVAAITADGRRHTLLNREFTIRWTDGRVEKRSLATPDELLAVLSEYFSLSFPPGTRFPAPATVWPS